MSGSCLCLHPDLHRYPYQQLQVPYWRKYDKTWLLSSTQSHCSVPFSLVDFHYMRKNAQFFVQDVSTASVLKAVNYKIRDEDNLKISITVNPSVVPHSVQNKLKPEQMEQLKLSMNKCYNDFQQTLDLQCFRFDPGLVGHDIDMILNRRNCMAATLKIIEKNFPELLSLNLRRNNYQLDGLSAIIQTAPKVKILNLSNNELKSTWELDKIKGLKLEELWLQGNPLCNNFLDQSTYVRYYWIYDFGDLQDLLGVYHEEACFWMIIPFNPGDPAPRCLDKYSKGNRNMKKLKDPVERMSEAHVHSFTQIFIPIPASNSRGNPKSLVKLADVSPKGGSLGGERVPAQESGRQAEQEMERKWLLSGSRIVVGGYEVVHLSSCLKAHSSSSLCIVNDQLSVREASHKETQSAFSIPVPTPPSSSMPTLSQEQQEMVQAFYIQSSMKLEWPQK
ncbi:LOW QUALITY PROTEIN: nuclear RNA export factor 2-like [Trichechus inunguis]